MENLLRRGLVYQKCRATGGSQSGIAPPLDKIVGYNS